MSTQPCIYVVIPIYNCENLLEDAVFSVLNQPYKNIRIVLVDDGSKDGSPAICDRLQNEHDNITAIHQTNQGVSAARNCGIEYILSNATSKNDYIAFIDADDLWAKNCLTPNSIFDHDIICFGSCSMSYDGSKYSKPNSKLTEKSCLAIWESFWCIFISCRTIFKIPCAL